MGDCTHTPLLFSSLDDVTALRAIHLAVAVTSHSETQKRAYLDYCILYLG